MEWLKNWVNQIIIAVVIATLLELLLPGGKNKRYVKMVIHLYVLFAIIYPIVTAIKGEKIDNLANYKIENYLNSTVTTAANLDSTSMIETEFKNSVKEDIKRKLLLKGYKVRELNIDINSNEHSKNYGMLTKIELSIEKQKQKNSTPIQIETITVKKKNKKKEKNTLQQQEKEKVQKFLQEEYQVPNNQIVIY